MISSNTTAQTPPPLTIGTIRSLMDSMPPRETVALSSAWPADTAWSFKADRENITIMHPRVWVAAINRLSKAERDVNGMGLAPVNLDLPHNHGEAARIFGLLAEAMK